MVSLSSVSHVTVKRETLINQLSVLVMKSKSAIAAMHSPHSVFDIGHCSVIHCDAGGVSLVDQ